MLVRHLRLTLAAAVAAALVACQPQDRQQVDGGAIDTAAILASLDSLGAAVSQANSSGDAERFSATWAEDGILSAPGSALVRGRDAIVSDFRNRPALPPGGTMSITPLEIRVLSADWAYAFGVDTLTYTPQGAAEPKTETSTFLVLIRKTPEGWKTYREVLSANQAPGAPSKE